MAVYTYKALETKASCCDRMGDPSLTTFASANVFNRIQGSNGWDYRNFFQYDLSGIPEGATIKSALMKVYCYNWGDYADDGSTTNIARVTNEWSEGTCCWNNMPTWEGKYLANDVLPPAVNSWAEWDITTLVTEWIEGVYPNYGLHIINNNEGNYRNFWDIRNHYYDAAYSNDDDESNDLGTYILVEYEYEETVDPEEPTDPEVPEEDEEIVSAYYKISRELLMRLANAVRNKANISDKLTPPEAIAEIYKLPSWSFGIPRVKYVDGGSVIVFVEPDSAAIAETFSGFSTRGKASIGELQQEITGTLVVLQQTIASSDLAKWQYSSDRYVEKGDNGVQLVTSWTYTSEEQEIDSGRMVAVKAITNDLVSVESMEVLRNGKL